MRRFSLIFMCLLVSGCASYGGYEPTVDTYNDPRADSIEKDLGECKVIAKKSADTIKNAGKGSVVGGMLGAAAGAVIGAVSGSPGKGATLGAAIGGTGGGIEGGISAEEKFKRVYRNCMRNRGHRVLD